MKDYIQLYDYTYYQDLGKILILVGKDNCLNNRIGKSFTDNN